MLDMTRDDGHLSNGHGPAPDAPSRHHALETGQAAVFRRHWWIALLTFAVVLGTAVGSFFLIDPLYRAEAEVLIRTEDSAQLFPRTSGPGVGSLVQSPGAEVTYASSDAFRETATAAAEGADEVEVSTALGSSVLTFAAEADDPDRAAETAQIWADTYITQRRQQELEETTQLRDALVGDRTGFEARRTELLQPLTALDEAIVDETDPDQLSLLLNQRLAVQRGLEGQLDALEAELRRVDERISDLNLDLRVLERPEALAVVTRSAEAPEDRINGSLTQSLGVGVVGGLLLAAGAVTVADRLRRH